MRKLIIAASIFAFAVPAAAQQRHDPRDEAIARNLPPPGEVAEIGDRLGRTADALMDMDVGPVIDAVDPYGRPHRRYRDETLGGIASRDDPYARQRIHNSIGAATAGIQAALYQMAILAPVLRRSIEETRLRMDEAMRTRDYRDGRDWERDRHDDRYDRHDDRDDYPDRDD